MRRVAVLLAVLLICWGVGVVSAEPTKVISEMNVTPGQIEKASHDFSVKVAKITNANIPTGLVHKNGAKKISVSVETQPRESGGVTVELFCEDNTGRFMPVWGGSVTTISREWTFTKGDIHRQNIDGCYFCVVDSTAEMEAMS